MKTTSLLHGIAALALVAAVLAPYASAVRAATPPPESLGPDIVVNGGFERGADPGDHLYLTAGISPQLEGWTVVWRIGVYGTGWQAQEGTRSLGLLNVSNTANTAGGVGQTLKTTVGQKYRVAFYQAGNPVDHKPSTLRAQIGAYQHDYTYQSAPSADAQHMDWVQRTFTYTAVAATTPISFTATYSYASQPVGLDNVQVRAILSGPTSAAPAGGVGVKPASSTVAAGGTEAITVTTAPGAPLVLVVDYPDGTQVVKQAKADSTGHYTLSLTLPAGVTGQVHVWVDSKAATAQATFSVS